MAAVDFGAGYAEATESAHDHLGVLVAVEDGGGADDAVVYVAAVVEDGAASRAAAYELHAQGIFGAGFTLCPQLLYERKVDF